MDKVAIVIVNWNTGSLLAKCLQALQALPEKESIQQVMIVDNASADTSVPEAKVIVDQSVPIEFILSPQNLGFAAGNNKGIQALQQRGVTSAHILLLNPDTAVQPHAITKLCRTLDRQPRAGIVGPKLLNPDGTHQPSVRRFPTFTTFLYILLKLDKLFPRTRLWQKYIAHDFSYSVEQPIDQVMGAAFLIRHNLIKEVGLLDAGFWVWFEEVDYCRRAKTLGWQTYYTPTASVTHYGGASFHQLVGWHKSWPWIRSSLRYARKHLSAIEALLLHLAIPASLVVALVATPLHRKLRALNQARL